MEATVEATAVAVRDIGGSVRRAAVDQDQLEVPAGLPGDAVEASTRGRRHVTVLIDTQVG
jgi:hypothetical protein